LNLPTLKSNLNIFLCTGQIQQPNLHGSQWNKGT